MYTVPHVYMCTFVCIKLVYNHRTVCTVLQVLVQEVGEGVTISGLSKSNGWKGRAQQILSLQNKVQYMTYMYSCTLLHIMMMISGKIKLAFLAPICTCMYVCI